MGLLTDQKHTYATPFEVWSQVERNDPNTVPPFFLEVCESMADSVDTFTRRHFSRALNTELHDRPDRTTQDPTKVHLNEDLLELTSLTVGRVSPVVWVAETDFWLKPSNETRKRWLQAEPGRTFMEAGDLVDSIAIEGDWGFSLRGIARGVIASGDMTDSQLTLPVDPSSTTIAEMAGMTVEVDDERMYLTASDDNEPVCERAILGTTAAAHLAGAPITRILAPADVWRATVEWAAWSYRRAQAGFTDIAGAELTGELVFSKEMPVAVRRILEPYRKTRFA